MPGSLMGARVRLEPTREQARALLCHAGAARWAYNWALGVRRAAYAHAGLRENAISLHKLLNSLKPTLCPWMYEVSKCAAQEALRDLDTAYKNWWRRLGEGKKGKAAGAPRHKSRQRDGIGGFRLTGSIRVEHEPGDGSKGKPRSYIILPRIGRVRLAEADRLPVGRLAQVSVQREGGALVRERASARSRAHQARAARAPG